MVVHDLGQRESQCGGRLVTSICSCLHLKAREAINPGEIDNTGSA